MQGVMRSDLYQELYEVENIHWWHQHKRATVHLMIEKYAKNMGKILDIGSGTGKILEELKDRGWQIEGVDGAGEAVDWSRKRGIPIKQTNFVKNKLPYKDNSFDVVLALDLLEHLPNDEAVIKEMLRVVKSGGIAVITVPAYQWLYNYWDEMLGHQRRYSIFDLRTKVIKAGWQIVCLSYYFCLFLIPAVLVRKIKEFLALKSNPASDFKTTPIAWISVPLMNLYARLERWLLARIQLPFGLSIIVVLEKNYVE